MAGAVLCTAVLLFCIGLSIAAPQTATKRQSEFDTGECTVSQYLEIVRDLDPLCLNHTARFEELSIEISLGSGRPSREIAEELRSLAGATCGDRCALVGYRLGRECFPDDESQAYDDAVASCSSNGRFICGLSLVEAQNPNIVREASGCLTLSAGDPDRCRGRCANILRLLVNDIGCCAYSYLDVLTLTGVTTASVERLYESCGVSPPRPCPNPFTNDTTPTRPPSCRRREYRCPNGDCIPDLYVCDGDEDCPSGDDEQSCPTVATDGGTDTVFVVSGSGSGSGSICSSEMILEIFRKYTPECETASFLLSELLDEYFNTTIPDPYLVQETLEAARNVCSRGCAGVTYELLTMCYPDSEDTAEYILDFCSRDEDRICGVAYLTVSDSQNFANALGCVVTHRPGRCPPVCAQALNDFVEDVTCCANHYFKLTFLDTNITDLYEACDVDDRGFCPNPFEDFCRPREFLCRKDQTCISRRRLCDGVKDCSDGSDEKLPRCPTVITPTETDIFVGLFPSEMVVSEASPRARLRYCVEVFKGEIDERVMVQVESTYELGHAERGRDYRNFTDYFALMPGGEDDYSPRGNPLYCRFHNLAIMNDRMAEKTELEYFYLAVYGSGRVGSAEDHYLALVYIADDDIAHIGFLQPSYRVSESNGSVEVCVGVLRGELGYPINFRVDIVEGTAEEDSDYNTTRILPALGYISHVRPPRRQPRPTTEPPTNETRTPPTGTPTGMPTGRPTGRPTGTRTQPTDVTAGTPGTPDRSRGTPTGRPNGTRTPPTGIPEPTGRPPMRPDRPRPGTWCVDLPIIDDEEEEDEETIVLEVFTGDPQLYTGRRRRTVITIVDDDAPQPLDAYLIGGTPRVSVGTVEVAVATNKRATVECRLARRGIRETMDCSPGTTATFTGLQSGTYTLRVTATRDDESHEFTQAVVVPASDSECIVNLVNRGVDINGPDATVEFVGVGPVVGFVCRLDGDTYPCTSPQRLNALSAGRHRLRVTPMGCPDLGTQRQTFILDI